MLFTLWRLLSWAFWELEMLNNSPALCPHRLGSHPANKTISQARNCHIPMWLTWLRWFLYCHMSVICTRGFCPVLGPFLSGRVLGISAELSWGRFIPPVVVFWCPSFPGNPWTKVRAAWTLLREAAHPLIHWCRSCRALLYQIRSDFVCAQVRCQEISCRYPTWSLFLLQVVAGRQGNKNVQQGLANSVSSQGGDCRNPSPHLVQCLWTRISTVSLFTLRITES